MADNGLDIGALSGRIELNDNFTPGLTLIANQIKSFGGSIKEGFEDPIGTAKEAVVGFLEDLGPLGVGLVGIGTIATVAGGALFEIASHAAEAGEGVLAFSRITGTAVDQVGSLSAAASIGGSSLDSLQMMLFQMQRRMDAGGDAAVKFNGALGNLGVSADEFRAADPTDRIAMLSTAMHNAAGNTNLMSDAIAVMGRGAVRNMPLLMKNFDDLKAKGEEVAYQWSVEDTKAAEEFSEAENQLGEQLKGMATTVGVALIPAMTGAIEVTARMITAVKNVADLGGLVSGSWHLLTGVIGNTADEEERFAAVQDTVNRLWKDAAADSNDVAEQAEIVAKKMLELGYSTKVVGEQTGLSDEKIREISGTMKVAEKASADFASAMDRVTQATSGGNDIKDVDADLRDWVKDLLDANVKMEDIVTVTGLTTGQINELKTAIKEADKEAQLYADAWTNLNSLGATYQSTVEGMNKETVDAIKFYLQAGASQGDLAKAYGLTADQVKAVATARTAEIDGLKEEQRTAQAALDAEAALDKTKIDNQRSMMGILEKQDEEHYAAELAQGKITEQQYSSYVRASRENLAQQNEAGYRQEANDELDALTSKQAAEQTALAAQYQQNKIDYDDFVKSKQNIDDEYAAKREQTENNYTTASKQRQNELQSSLKQTGAVGSQSFQVIGEADAMLNNDIDNTNKKVLTLDGELMDAVKYKQMMDSGGSTDVTSANFAGALDALIHPMIGVSRNQYRDPYVLAKSGYSLAEIMKYAFDSTQQGPLPPPSGPRIPGFSDGGIGDFGSGTLAMLHGPEAIIPLNKGGIGGSPTLIFNVNGTAVQVAQQIKDIILRELMSQKQIF